MIIRFQGFHAGIGWLQAIISFTNHDAHLSATQALRNSLLVSRHWRPEFDYMADVIRSVISEVELNHSNATGKWC